MFRRKPKWELALLRRIVQHRKARLCELGVTADGTRCQHPDCEFNAARRVKPDTPATKAKVAEHMTKHKFIAAVALVAVLGLFASACSTVQVFEAGIISLQGAAIADGQAGAIPVKDEQLIVTYTTQCLTAIAAKANGWQASIQSATASFIKDLPASDQQKYAAVIAVIEGAVGGL